MLSDYKLSYRRGIALSHVDYLEWGDFPASSKETDERGEQSPGVGTIENTWAIEYEEHEKLTLE